MIEPKNLTDDELVVLHRNVIKEIKRRAQRDLPLHNVKRKLCKGCMENGKFTICPMLEAASVMHGRLSCHKPYECR